MNHIIESIGKHGVVTSSLPSRFTHPKPGDVIDLSEVEGEYPFVYGQWGRVDSDHGWVEKDELHICCELGSAYLREDGDIDLSGGPFEAIKKSQLEHTYKTKLVTFWNWGDNLPGADQGVHYWIERPVFKLKKAT